MTICLPGLWCCCGYLADRYISEACLLTSISFFCPSTVGARVVIATPPTTARLPSNFQATENQPPELCSCVSLGSLGFEECFLWPSSLGSWLNIWSLRSSQSCHQQNVLCQQQALVRRGAFESLGATSMPQ